MIRQYHLFFIISFLIPVFVLSQYAPKVLWNVSLFYVPENKSSENVYVEIAITMNASSLKKKKISQQEYVCAIQGIIEIWKDSTLIKLDTFIVKSPVSKDSTGVPDFIYLKRYWINNHQQYTLQLKVKDFFDKTKMEYCARKNFYANFDENKVCLSSILFIDTLEKSDKVDMFYRYGYSVIPYNTNYFNEYFSQIKFLCEIYNTEKVLGKEELFMIKYFIRDKDSKKNLEQFGGFKKMKASKVNVWIGSVNIKELPSGNYDLIVEVRNKQNEILNTQIAYFQRKNYAGVVALGVNDEVLFGKTNNIDSLKMLVEALWPIANNLEKEWIVNQALARDATMMKNFIVEFWNRRAADTTSSVKLATGYYSNLNYVMKNFKCGKIASYYTDRGRVYLQYGAPNQRVVQMSEPGAYPYEIWQYYRIYDASTGQFFSNKRFVFVNKGIADDCYILIHSDMKGEINNPNWQREIMKYEVYNPNDPYQQQKLNYGNNFDKLYQNPQ